MKEVERIPRRMVSFQKWNGEGNGIARLETWVAAESRGTTAKQAIANRNHSIQYLWVIFQGEVASWKKP